MIIEYDGPRVMHANALFKARMKITLEESIRPGGRIAVAARHTSDFGDAQMDDPDAENFVLVETSREGIVWRLVIGTDGCRYRHPWRRGFDLILERGRLLPGDLVTIQLGGRGGFRGQSFVEEKFRLRVGVLSEAEAGWVVMPEEGSPGWEIIGTRPTMIRVRVPDVNGQGSVCSVCLKLEDTYGNPAGPCDADLMLLLDDQKCLRRVHLSAGMSEPMDVSLPTDGAWHRLTAVSEDGGLFGRSNPFGPSLMEGYRLYWGDLHCHTGLDACTGSPESQYRHGRQVAGLDFACVCPLERIITEAEWEICTQATKEAHHPGTYVTFLGYESHARLALGGDHIVYFLGDEGPLLRRDRYWTAKKWGQTHPPGGETHPPDKVRTIADIIAELGEHPALVIPHGGGSIADFDFYDAEKMPVLEIHSCHRNYQEVAHEATRRGIRFGFIGDSDDHRGALGDSRPVARDRYMSTRGGLVAVYARELTRQSIWEAIFARRVYATNGCRIALGFWANDVPMGSELEVEVGADVRFAFDIVLDGWLDRVELVCHTEILETFVGVWNQIDRFGGEYVVRARPGSTAYYLRVHQSDGGIAWSSPIWVTSRMAKALHTERHRG